MKCFLFFIGGAVAAVVVLYIVGINKLKKLAGTVIPNLPNNTI